MNEKFKILALDGGGVRGVVQTRILERLEARIGKRLKADLVAGTSVGSFLTLGYQDYAPSEMLEIFKANARFIFNEHKLKDDLKALWGLIGARHKNKPLEKVLANIFKDKTLGDLEQKVLVTTFNLDGPKGFWRPEVITNLEGPYKNSETKLLDAALRSSASPVFLPIYQNYCDGGVWGNNPSISALAASCDKRVLGKKTEDCVVFSIGTGREQRRVDCPDGDLGALQWFLAGLIQLLFYSNMDAAHYYTESFLNERYFRIQADLGSNLSNKLFDDYKTIPDLIRLADGYDIEPALEWLENHWL